LATGAVRRHNRSVATTVWRPDLLWVAIAPTRQDRRKSRSPAKIRASRLRRSGGCQTRGTWPYQTLRFPSQTFCGGRPSMTDPTLNAVLTKAWPHDGECSIFDGARLRYGNQVSQELSPKSAENPRLSPAIGAVAASQLAKRAAI